MDGHASGRTSLAERLGVRRREQQQRALAAVTARLAVLCRGTATSISADQAAQQEGARAPPRVHGDEERVRVDALTTQQSALHRILLQMLAHKKPIHSCSDQPRRQLQTQFTELVRTRETLEMERQQLLMSVVGHTQRFTAFQIMVQRMQSITNGITDPGGVESGHWIEFLPDEPRLLYEPESPASVQAILQAGLAAIQRVHDSLSHPLCSHAIASCLGWRAEQTREVVDASTGRFRLQMRFTKRIPRSRATLEELRSKTWDFLNSPTLIARVNNAAVTAHIVQQLDDDTIVLLRNSPDAYGHKRFRYFSLNARRIERDGAVGVVMLVLDKEAAAVDEAGRLESAVRARTRRRDGDRD